MCAMRPWRSGCAGARARSSTSRWFPTSRTSTAGPSTTSSTCPARMSDDRQWQLARRATDSTSQVPGNDFRHDASHVRLHAFAFGVRPDELREDQVGDDVAKGKLPLFGPFGEALFGLQHDCARSLGCNPGALGHHLRVERVSGELRARSTNLPIYFEHAA